MIKWCSARGFKPQISYIFSGLETKMDLSHMVVKAVKSNSVDGDYWGCFSPSDEESSGSSEGKGTLGLGSLSNNACWIDRCSR